MTIWQVANGQSIQAAIVEAADGDTIEVGAGTYTENLTIDKAVTIVGANAGIAGTGARDSETIIKGTTTVTATTGPVRIDERRDLQHLQRRHSVHRGQRPHHQRCHHREQHLLFACCQRQQ